MNEDNAETPDRRKDDRCQSPWERHARHGWHRRRFWPLKILGGIVLGAGLLAGLTALVMFLWNAVTPGLFGWPKLLFWQAGAILIGARILFGGFGGGGRGWHRRGHHCHGDHGPEHLLHDNPFFGRGHYVNWWKEKGRADFEAWVKEQKKA